MQIPKQVRQINNSKEQLRITKSELQSVNNELSKALLRKESVLDSVKEAKSENLKIKKDSKVKTSELKIKELELNNKESKLFMKEDKVNKSELTSIIKIEVEQKKLDSNKTNYSKRLADLTDKIGQSELELSEVSESIKNNNKIKKDLIKEVNKLSTENSKLDSKFTVQEQEYKETIKNLDTEIKEQLEELDLVKNEILAEQQKVGSAKKSIKLEHKLLERRKRNLDIMIVRFNKVFKEHYPLLELKV